jgi:hypothetical protein
MILAIPNDATHAAVITIRFAEGEPEESVVALGSFEECDRAARLLPATSYSGSRQPVDASVSVVPLVPFCQQCQQRHESECA